MKPESTAEPGHLRRRLYDCGPEGLSDTQLLALLIGAIAGRYEPADAAGNLMRRFGSLRGVLTSSPQNLGDCPGVGVARAATVGVVLEIARRHYREALERGPALTSPGSTRDFLRAQLRDLAHEVFGCLLLDNRHRVLRFEILFRGTIDGASVHPREVVKLALERNAAAVILTHNHPSGVAEPSDADRRITHRLRDALELMDIRVLDHLVVGDGECVSFAERGLL